VNDHAVSGATEVRRDLFGPGERCVKSDCPAVCHVRERVRTTPLVDQRNEIFHLLGNAIEVGHLVVHTHESTLGTGAVVAGNVDEQRIIQLADVVQRINEASHLGVGLLHEARKHLGLTSKELAIISRKRVPIHDFFGLLGQFGTSGDDAHLSLAFGCLLPGLVPTLVKLPLVFVGPRPGHVVRRVDSAGCIVHEKGLVRRHRLLGLDPVDRLVGHVHGEVIALRMRRRDPGDAVID